MKDTSPRTNKYSPYKTSNHSSDFDDEFEPDPFGNSETKLSYSVPSPEPFEPTVLHLFQGLPIIVMPSYSDAVTAASSSDAICSTEVSGSGSEKHSLLRLFHRFSVLYRSLKDLENKIQTKKSFLPQNENEDYTFYVKATLDEINTVLVDYHNAQISSKKLALPTALLRYLKKDSSLIGQDVGDLIKNCAHLEIILESATQINITLDHFKKTKPKFKSKS